MFLYKKLLNNFINNIVYQLKIKEKYFTLFPKIKFFLVKYLAINLFNKIFLLQTNINNQIKKQMLPSVLLIISLLFLCWILTFLF